VSYVENRPGRLFRQWNVGGRPQRGELRGDHLQSSIFLNSWAQGKNFWTYNLNFGATLPTLDDRLTRGGPLARRPWNWRVFNGIGTDWRKPVTGWLGAFLQASEGGGFARNVWMDVEVKPAPNVSLTLSPSLDRSRLDSRSTSARWRTRRRRSPSGAAISSHRWSRPR
jgi:hypothetical protein